MNYEFANEFRVEIGKDFPRRLRKHRGKPVFTTLEIVDVADNVHKLNVQLSTKYVRRASWKVYHLKLGLDFPRRGGDIRRRKSKTKRNFSTFRDMFENYAAKN